MKDFKQFINEMGVETGVRDPSTSNTDMKSDWNTYYKNSNDIILMRKDIGSSHYSLYKVGSSWYFLTNKDKEYKGAIQYKRKEKTIIIQNSHSDLPRGFYSIVFTSILSLPEVNEIISDNQLSTNALNSYEKLKVNEYLELQVLTPQGYIPFSREAFKNDPYNRISIKGRGGSFIQETFEEYYRRIYEDKNSFNSMWKRNAPELDNHLFCENFLE